jgi:hypothetical protein
LTVEVLLDDTRHARLPIADDEIVDRAVAIRDVRGAPVDFVTYDAGAAFRASASGLHVHRLVHPPSERNGQSRRGRPSQPEPAPPVSDAG